MGVADMSEENTCPQCGVAEMVEAPKYHRTDHTSRWVCHNCDHEMTPEPDYEAMANDW